MVGPVLHRWTVGLAVCFIVVQPGMCVQGIGDSACHWAVGVDQLLSPAATKHHWRGQQCGWGPEWWEKMDEWAMDSWLSSGQVISVHVALLVIPVHVSLDCPRYNPTGAVKMSVGLGPLQPRPREGHWYPGADG